MKKLFDELLPQSTMRKNVACIDTTISFRSTQMGIIDHFVDRLQEHLPRESELSKRQVTCVIAPTDVVDNWPDPLIKEGDEVIEVEELTQGVCTQINSDDGSTLVMNHIGSIYHSGEGHFLCLVKDTEIPLKEQEVINILGLAMLLASETLLLSKKLLIHGGAVGRDGKCQIWTGKSGSGKTTRVLQMVKDGFAYYGDDQIILGKDSEDQWRVWPLWRQLMVTEQSSKLLPNAPDLSSMKLNEIDKYEFDDIEGTLNVTKPDSALLTEIIKLVPGDSNILRPMEFDEAFKELSAEFIHSLLPTSTASAMDIFLDVITEIPVSKVSWDRVKDCEKL